MADVKDWQPTASGNNSGSSPDYPVEGMAPSAVNDVMRENMAATRRWQSDVDASLVTAGSNNNYTLTTSQGISAYVAGMLIAFKANRSNTGAATLDINSVGATALQRPDGSALSVGDIIEDAFYVVAYDGDNSVFRVIAATPAAIKLISGTAVDLVDSDAPLVVGAGDSNHLEADGTRLQAKSDETTASTLALNPLGGNVAVGAQSGTGRAELWHDGGMAVYSEATGVSIRDTDGDVPIATLRGDDNSALGQLTYSAGFYLRNLVNGSVLVLDGRSSAGVTRSLLNGDPDGALTGYYAGSRAINTSDVGIGIFDTVGNNPTASMYGSDNARNAYLQASRGSGLIIQNEVHGGPVLIRGEDAGGTVRLGLQVDPDGATTAYYLGSARFSTTSAGASLTGTLTLSGTPTAATHAATKGYTDDAVNPDNYTELGSTAFAQLDEWLMWDQSANAMRAVKYRDTARPINSTTAVRTLGFDDANAGVVLRGATDRNFTVPPNSTTAFKIGTEIVLACPESGRIVLVAGGGVTIHHPDNLDTVRAGGTAVLWKIATDEWMFAGLVE